MKKVGIIVISVLAAVLLAVAGTLFWYYSPATNREALISRHAFAVRFGLKDAESKDTTMSQVREYAGKYWDDMSKNADGWMKESLKYANGKDSLTLAVKAAAKKQGCSVTPQFWKEKVGFERRYIPQTFHSRNPHVRKWRDRLFSSQEKEVREDYRMIFKKDEREAIREYYVKSLKSGRRLEYTLRKNDYESNIPAMQQAQANYQAQKKAFDDTLKVIRKRERKAFRRIPLQTKPLRWQNHPNNVILSIMMPATVVTPDDTSLVWIACYSPHYTKAKVKTPKASVFKGIREADEFLRGAAEDDFEIYLKQLLDERLNKLAKKKR